MSVKRITRIVLTCSAILFLSGCGGIKPKIDQEKDYIFFPSLPNEPRFQYLTTFSTSDDVKKKSSLFKFVAGKKELKARTIIKPYGIGIFEGIIYVCDLRSSAIIVIDLNKKSFGYMGVSGAGKLKKPANLFIDKTERLLYVTDTGRKQILAFDLKGKLKKAFGKIDEYTPADIMLYKGKIYISDLKSHQILVLDKKTGKIKKRIGEIGHLDDQLYHPASFDIHNDRIYISDMTNFRINIFGVDGKHISSFGSIGRRPGNFARPKGIDVDREGRIYVIDSAFENIQIFDKEFRLLLFMLSPGGEPHNINLPVSILIDYDNVHYFKKYISPDFKAEYILLVTSQFGRNKVNVYAFGKYEKN
ncbi:MAG: 6-bladed beta-propeller [Acidobacteriota bacterium]